LSYGDYVEQLTFLLFLKMAEEQSQPPFNKPSSVPKGYDWPSLMAKDGDELETHYRHVLETLGKRSGMLGVIFRKAQNKIQDPAGADPGGGGASVERNERVGSGGDRQPPTRHPPPPIHFAKSIHRGTFRTWIRSPSLRSTSEA
jgi:hypothetical protein